MAEMAMKPLRIKIHATKAAILLLASMSWGTAWGGVLDWFKSPSTLIMNQKNCTYMNRSMVGEMLNGKFLFSHAAGMAMVLMSMEKLDDNRVVAVIEQSEDREKRVLAVKKSDGAVTVSQTFPNGKVLLFVECRIAGQPMAKGPIFEPRSFKCSEPLPEFTLGPASNPSDAELAKLCACVWSKLPEGGWEREVSAKARRGEDPGWRKHGFAPRFGAAIDACGGRNL